MMVTGVTKTFTKMSFTSIALAVIFIIRLFSTSTFRVPKFLIHLPKILHWAQYAAFQEPEVVFITVIRSLPGSFQHLQTVLKFLVASAGTLELSVLNGKSGKVS